MSKYSENEKEVFQTILSDFDLRIDGRNKLELRQYHVEFNTLPSTYSSVRLLYGNNSKEIIFAGDIVRKSNEKLLNVNIESMYKIEDMKLKKEIEDQIENFIFKGINLKDLQVNQDNNEFFWKLYIDLYVMDVLKLSIFQFIGIGVKLLLKNINLPKIIVFQNKLNGDNEFDLLENYEDLSQNEKMRSFNNIDIPDIHCLGILRNTVILDPSEEEFSVIESIIFVSQLNGEVQNIQSIGSSIDLSKIQQITNIVKNINKNNNKMEEC